MSVNNGSTSGSISSKTVALMKELITIIKGMDTLENADDQVKLNRSLYRSMDALTVLKCQLLQVQVSLLSRPTFSNETPEYEDLTLTPPRTSAKTSSSTSILGKRKSRPDSKEDPTPESSTSFSTKKATQVNLPSASSYAGISKYPCSDGARLGTYYTSCQNSLTNLHTFLTCHDQNLKTGHETTSPQPWKGSRTVFSLIPNTSARK